MGVFCGDAAMLYLVARGIVLGEMLFGVVVVVAMFVNTPRAVRVRAGAPHGTRAAPSRQVPYAPQRGGVVTTKSSFTKQASLQVPRFCANIAQLEEPPAIDALKRKARSVRIHYSYRTQLIVVFS